MSLTERCVYRFSFIPEVTLASIDVLLKDKRADPRRVCYITTSHSRIYVWVVGGELKLVPCTHYNNAWRELHRHEWNVPEIPKYVLDSEEALFAFLEKAMARQFRDSVMGFYDELPDSDIIVMSIKDGTTAADLLVFQFSVYETCVNEDPEWDGGVEILCKGGRLVVPYFLSVPGSEDPRHKNLIGKYAMFVPDNKIKAFFSKIHDFFARLGNIVSVSDYIALRNKIDGGKQ